MIKLKIEEDIEISVKQLIAGILEMEDSNRLKVIEGITKINSLSNEKWWFTTSSRKLSKREDLTADEIIAIQTELNSLNATLISKTKKLQKEYIE